MGSATLWLVEAVNESGCCSPGCLADAVAHAPVALCSGHLALAAEWAGQEFGTDDVLPAPCVACGSRVGVRYPSGWVCAICEWTHGEIPDAELATPRVEVVYYVRFDDRIKIGTTGNLKQRMRAVWHDEVVALERGGRRRERSRHEQFAMSRLGGEWFAASADLMEHIEQVRAGVDDPWTLYARWVSESIALRS